MCAGGHKKKPSITIVSTDIDSTSLSNGALALVTARKPTRVAGAPEVVMETYEFCNVISVLQLTFGLVIKNRFRCFSFFFEL